MAEPLSLLVWILLPVALLLVAAMLWRVTGHLRMASLDRRKHEEYRREQLESVLAEYRVTSQRIIGELTELNQVATEVRDCLRALDKDRQKERADKKPRDLAQ